MLVWRRAISARSLLAAAAAAALIATVLLAGLNDYNRAVVIAGSQAAVAAAPAEERSLLVRAPISDPGVFQQAGAVLRAEIAAEMSGTEIKISEAGYAVGRQFAGPTGDASPDDNGLVFASVMFLDGLAEHGHLRAGTWPERGASPAQAVIGEAAAQALGLTVGSLVPILDRSSDEVTEIEISGVFTASQPGDPTWLLTPELFDGATPSGSTYGPIVLDRADFLAGGWAAGGRVGWSVEPQLAEATLDGLLEVRDAAQRVPHELPGKLGIATTGASNSMRSVSITTSLDRLADRLQRADLVGRSALLTPLLLIIVLCGYALLLLAGLLTEQRRGETALLRARGAARGQLAGLATREATLVALPAVVLTPPLVSMLLARSNDVALLARAGLQPTAQLGGVTWVVAALAGLGCVVAMVLPALRSGGTYVADMAAQSRPSRKTGVQRAGVDFALVAFAVLAWFQLRQYESPVTGVGAELGIDPLLAAAAPIGVLAGAVLALRLLPPLTRVLERVLDRRTWFATQLGMWQAGRRPHAGPVLLLALAVAVSTLAWGLAGTAERSLADQADHQVGTDLRLTEASGFAPSDRPAELASLPGVASVLPAWRASLALGEKSVTGSLLALDAADAAPMFRMRSDLGDGDELLGTLAGQRVQAPVVPLPPGARELRGVMSGSMSELNRNGGFFRRPPDVAGVTALLMDKHGALHRVALPAVRLTGPAQSFAVPLEGLPDELSLAGFQLTGSAGYGQTISWQVTKLAAIGEAGAVELDLTASQWHLAQPSSAGENTGRVERTEGGLDASVRQTSFGAGGIAGLRAVFTSKLADAPVPVVATEAALAAMHRDVGDVDRVLISGQPVSIKIVGTVTDLPGTATRAALLVDLPSLSSVLLHTTGAYRPIQEWWVATDPQQHEAAAAAAERLGQLRVWDRKQLALRAGLDPYGVGARLALFVAALGAILLALVGVAVDVRATARRRTGELAVLHTLGAAPRTLARALVTEQAFLAGLGVSAGLVVGIGVAAAMAPLVVLTPAADRPIPEPLLHLDWQPVAMTAVLLLGLAMGMAGLVATTMRQRLAAAQLRIGADR